MLKCEDWFNASPDVECYFSLGGDDEQYLTLEVTVAKPFFLLAACDTPPVDGESATTSFVEEGLWTGDDCAELSCS